SFEGAHPRIHLGQFGTVLVVVLGHWSLLARLDATPSRAESREQANASQLDLKTGALAQFLPGDAVRVAVVADAEIPGAFQLADDPAALDEGNAARIAADQGIAVDAQRDGKARCGIVVTREIAADSNSARSIQLADRALAMLDIDIAFDQDRGAGRR